MDSPSSRDNYTSEESDTSIDKHNTDPRPKVSPAAASKPLALIDLEESVPRDILERLPDLGTLTMGTHNRRKALSAKLLIGHWHPNAHDRVGVAPSPVWVYLYPLTASFTAPLMEIEVERNSASAGACTLLYHETESLQDGTIKYIYPFSRAVSETELFVMANYYFLVAVTRRILNEKPPLTDNGPILSRVLNIVCERLPVWTGPRPVVSSELESDDMTQAESRLITQTEPHSIKQAESDHPGRTKSGVVKSRTTKPVRKRQRQPIFTQAENLPTRQSARLGIKKEETGRR